MAAQTIGSLFATDVGRRIEEVIKVDQVEEEILRDEIREYVPTNSIKKHYLSILERFRETPNKPHEGVGIWVSGFFGSGKSSFAKLLGLAIEDHPILGKGAGGLFAEQVGDQRIKVLIQNIAEQIPTRAVIFDVSTDRGIRTGNQMLTEILYRQLLDALGYARDLDLAELEITLESEGQLERFKQEYAKLFGRDWDKEKGKVAVALSQASRVMQALDPATFPSADSWVQAARSRADISPNLLAQRCKTLGEKRSPGKSLLFVIDEVGQFVARDVQKMLDLQGIVQALGRVGRGKVWIAVTSQEKLSELVGGLDDKRVELARLMDRFPQELQVHLEPSDISEVTSRRVLSKNADSQSLLRKRFEENRARLSDSVQLTADIRLPELTTERFVDLYPLLPYQIDLIIQVVSGLRSQGGASKHVGGANRTIIKLAQQLLINPAVNLAARPVGALATLDQIYDLVETNIESEVRGKIGEIARTVDHPLAPAVCKAVCLLQFVKSIHRTEENIAATLHPAVDADSQRPAVKQALEALLKAQKIRRGDDGYRIPTPAEDDWEIQRAKISAKSGEIHRIHAETISQLWDPQPSHALGGVKLFKAGLHLNGREIVEGDITVDLHLALAGKECQDCIAQYRKLSQTETKSLFWIAALDDAIDNETVDIHRSQQMLARKERTAQKTELALVTEEKHRLARHQGNLKRLLTKALLAGTIFFRGNDRSPDEGASHVGETVISRLKDVLPDVFDRFAEAAARVAKVDLVSLMTSENLHGLTPVFAQLALVHDVKGKPVFRTESGPFAEVYSRIENQYEYGIASTGKSLADDFASEPFGWDFDVVRLLVVALVRAGRIEATSKGRTIDSALSVEARNTFENNNLFRQASFAPKRGDVVEFADLVKASEAFKHAFGKELPELEQSAAAAVIRDEIGKHEPALQDMHTSLLSHRLPGSEVLGKALEHVRAIRAGSEASAILAFIGCHSDLKEAVKRTAELERTLTEPALLDLERARKVLDAPWSFLQSEPDLPEDVRSSAVRLEDTLKRETFFRELPAIDQLALAVETAYNDRLGAAIAARADAYTKALAVFRATPGWESVDEEQRRLVAGPLESRADATLARMIPIPELRADIDACPARLDRAVQDLLQIREGERLVKISAGSYFSGGIESEEQLEASLGALRDECLHHLGAGKKVLIQ
jgi:hypothetical protein